MYKISPQLAALDQVHTADADALSELARGEGKTNKEGFASPVKDFYFTNPIARASRIMADCSMIKNRTHLQAAE
jgi:NADH-quinone oxidoreductase subunit G